MRKCRDNASTAMQVMKTTAAITIPTMAPVVRVVDVVFELEVEFEPAPLALGGAV